mmetsp:Transcript_8271/g.13151  ORF Transcript_8271/g.13151 Transcript_8271/m.13151 type:complete len:89 (+) Transcript_8271:2794-3060(+)
MFDCMAVRTLNSPAGRRGVAVMISASDCKLATSKPSDKPAMPSPPRLREDLPPELIRQNLPPRCQGFLDSGGEVRRIGVVLEGLGESG